MGDGGRKRITVKREELCVESVMIERAEGR